MKYCLALAVSAALAGCSSLPASDAVLGTRPTYLAAASTGFPNEAALRQRMWVPGLDQDYVPQGLAAADGVLYVSSYRPMPDLKATTGPCRVFQIDMATGNVTGAFDVPPGTCTHAGGLAHVGNGKLLLADTRRLFLIDLPRALAAGTSAGASRSLVVQGALRGSYASFDGRDAWIGTWTRERHLARMYRLPLSLFDSHDGQAIDERQAEESFMVPMEAQGAAFDRSGHVWVSASNSRWGRLYKLDRQGSLMAQYEMLPGLEDLSVDPSGALWGLSESGSRKYLDWETRVPQIFRIQVDRLR